MSARRSAAACSASVERARLADREADALGAVVAAVDGEVDPGVDGVRGEVEQQRLVVPGRSCPVTVPHPAVRQASSRRNGARRRIRRRG
jgi:hypothetical protein